MPLTLCVTEPLDGVLNEKVNASPLASVTQKYSNLGVSSVVESDAYAVKIGGSWLDFFR